MEKPWFHKLFYRPETPPVTNAQSKAAGGDADAQFSLGLKYANSPGVAPDYVQAANWYLKAATQNHALAQFNLGIMYARGQGVTKDVVTACDWIGRAAQQGDAGAQFALGMHHQRASQEAPTASAQESRLEAYKWLHLAADQGYHGSQNAFELISLHMTHAEVTDGKRRVAEFDATAT